MLPTVIPKSQRKAGEFKKDYTLADVVEIAEQDPGVGFRLKGQTGFYLLDEHWHVDAKKTKQGTRGPWLAQWKAHGIPGVSWAPSICPWNAALRIWRLVDLTKHPDFLDYIAENYMGQGVTDRRSVSPQERKRMEAA